MHNIWMDLCLSVSRATIRTRVMCAIVLVAMVALVISGALVLVLGLRSTHEAIDARFQLSRNGLEHLAATKVDPVSGEELGSADKVLQSYLRRAALGREEGELGIVDGQLRWLAPTGQGLRPEEDPALVEHVVSLAASPQSRMTSVTTASGRYRVLLVPISDGSRTAAYVRVVDLAKAEAGVYHTIRVYALAACGAVALVTGLAWFGVERLLRPIAQLRRATEAINAYDLDTRVRVSGQDDLSQLTDAVNRMLDRMKHAVESQRDLLDDVGHELRTPVTVVRGHLELMDANDPDDVRQTSALAIDELDRMSALVEELLVLARSSQADYVHPAPTDVEELTLQVLDKATALGDRVWRLEANAQVTAVLDPARVTQAWLQLVSNAVKYSPDKSVVGLGSRVEGSTLSLWVRDQGTGIAAQEIPRITERFARSKATRGKVPGHGLGLSIVESIIRAHEGRLDIDSTLGKGSVFTLRLPLTAPGHSTVRARERTP